MLTIVIIIIIAAATADDNDTGNNWSILVLAYTNILNTTLNQTCEEFGS